MIRHLAVGLFLLASPALAGINFDGTTNASALTASTELTGTPFTVCARARPATVNNWVVFAVSDNVANNDQFLLFFDNGGLIQALISHGGSAFASTKGTYTANVWHVVCGKFVSSVSRTVFLDSVAGTTNTNSLTPSGIIATGVGSRPGTTVAPFSGDLAEVGVWDVDLSTNEFNMINSGYAPPCVNRAHLVLYYQMLARNGSTLPDFFGNTQTNLTLGSGTSTGTLHPPVINCQ